jgi:prevent-host-death family protein
MSHEKAKGAGTPRPSSFWLFGNWLTKGNMADIIQAGRDGETMSIVVSVSEVKSRLSELLDRAANGEEVIIEQRGKIPVALVPRTKSAADGKKSTSAETPSQRGERLAQQLGNRHRLSPEKQARLERLAKKNQAGTLTEKERREMMRLLREYGRLTVERAQAMCEMP